MKILITNDDGIYAHGLSALYKRFAISHFVTVVAPDRERSAISHAIT
ncbi:MAG: 5'/3'-nucleotidase SurE, partial [Desulfobacterales bacterium]